MTSKSKKNSEKMKEVVQDWTQLLASQNQPWSGMVAFQGLNPSSFQGSQDP